MQSLTRFILVQFAASQSEQENSGESIITTTTKRTVTTHGGQSGFSSDHTDLGSQSGSRQLGTSQSSSGGAQITGGGSSTRSSSGSGGTRSGGQHSGSFSAGGSSSGYTKDYVEKLVEHPEVYTPLPAVHLLVSFLIYPSSILPVVPVLFTSGTLQLQKLNL